MALRITTKDRGYESLKKTLDLSRQKLDIGIFSPEGDVKYEENGATVMMAALFAEFGTKTQPKRSFLRAWFDQNEDLLKFWLKGEWERVARGEQTMDEALANVGRRAAHAIKQRILNGLDPDNAPSTVKKKGYNFPLLGLTGRLIAAISYRINGRAPRGVNSK